MGVDRVTEARARRPYNPHEDRPPATVRKDPNRRGDTPRDEDLVGVTQATVPQFTREMR